MTTSQPNPMETCPESTTVTRAPCTAWAAAWAARSVPLKAAGMWMEMISSVSRANAWYTFSKSPTGGWEVVGSARLSTSRR